MHTCIYCRSTGGSEAFTREHVVHDGFGGFKDGLTLVDAVCGNCNQYFANDIDRYLLRDTIDGFNRFRKGQKPVAEYKSEGRRSTLEFRIDSGPYRGLRVFQQAHEDRLGVRPLPQVGFSLEAEGPYDWYPRDRLPGVDELKKKFPPGSNLSIEFFEIDDPHQVMSELSAQGMGANQTELREVRPANWQGPEYRIEAQQQLGLRFARAIAKVSFNYFAHQFGIKTALANNFDEIRSFIRLGERPDWLRWEVDKEAFSFPVPHSNGHLVGVAFDEGQQNRVVGLVSFFMFARYRVTLSRVGFATLCNDSIHFFDCDQMTARSLHFA